MMRILLQHVTRYRIRSFGTLPSPTAANQTLQHRITEALDRNAQIIPVLELWRQQRNQVNPSHVRVIIKKLRDSDQSLQALQVLELMSHARLHLVENVVGLEEAEKFFENIPENMKDYSVYAALLSSYAKSDKTLGKAKATFKKMRELGFLMRPSPFNSMLSLCSQENAVEEILRKMEENKVDPNSNTVNTVLKLYAAESKVEAMEMFMRLWGREDGIKIERGTMVAMAKAYAKAGSTKNAVEMYGDVAGSQREVYRLWNECKKQRELEDDDEPRAVISSMLKLDDDGYRTVIRSLLKLDDVEGAEKVYGGWKPAGPELDLSIPGLLISRFCAEGKALKVGEMVKSIGEKRNWMHLTMLKAFTFKVVEGVALCVAFLCFMVVYTVVKNPMLLIR